MYLSKISTDLALMKVDDVSIEKAKDRYLSMIGYLQMPLDLPSVLIGITLYNQNNFASTLTSTIVYKAGIKKLRIEIPIED